MPTPTLPTVRRGAFALIVVGLILIVGIFAFMFQSGRELMNARQTRILGSGGSVTVANVPPMMGYGTEYSEGIISQDAYGIAGKMMIAPSPYPAPGAGSADRERIGPKIIRNGSLTLRVDDVEKRADELKTLALSKNGFVASSNISDVNGVKNGYLTIRIPSDKFDETVAAAKKLALVVFNESSNADDVTAQYVDLDARLRAAKAEEAQYLEILKQARSVEDTLNVSARLADVRTRIEQIQGQLRSLNDQTDYATLNISLTQSAKVEIPTRTWKPFETLKESLRVLVIALQALVDIIITGLVFLAGFLLPIILVIVLAAWIVRMIWRKVFPRR